MKAAFFTSEKWGPRREEDRTNQYANNSIRLESTWKPAGEVGIENEAGSCNGGYIHPTSGPDDDLPDVPATPCASSGADQAPDIDTIQDKDVLNDLDSPNTRKTPRLGQIATSTDSTFDSFEATESGSVELPPTPHRMFASQPGIDVTISNKDVFVESLPADGYITPVAKRPAPSIPSPTRCGSGPIKYSREKEEKEEDKEEKGEEAWHDVFII